MESSMVGNHNIDIVKSFFKEKLPGFTVTTETSHGPYWEVRLKSGEIEIKVFGDIGFSVDLIINGSKFELWQYDRNVNNAMNTNDPNIIYQLGILYRFLMEDDK